MQIDGFKIGDKPNISIDFDKVLHSYEYGFTNCEIYGTVISGSIEAVNELSKKYNIIIFTCRKPIRKVKKWLKANNIYFDKVTDKKMVSSHYIDDRAVRFIDWKTTMEEIENYENVQ